MPQGGDDPAVVYVANVGQWQHPADFVAQIGATTAFLTADGIRLAFVAPGSEPLRTVSARERLQAPRQARQGAAVDLRFVGARTVAPLADPTTIRSGRRNFFVGEQSTWRTEVPGYGAVTYPDLYAGVDVRCYALDGHFEYDVELAPGADLSAVVVELAGVDAVSLDGDGALQFATAAGFVRQPAPMAFVGSGADRRPTAAGFRLLGNNRFGFSVPGWDGEQALVIDPGLLYSAVFGGVPVSGGTIPYDTAQSATGVVTIVGNTDGLPYPATPGAFLAAAPGGGDLFITQLDPSLPTTQQHRYTTYLGGTGGEDMPLVDLGATGLITVTAWSDSTNYPTTAGAYTTVPSGYECVVTQLDPALTGAAQLVYSSHFGGSTYDVPLALGHGFAGEIVIAGFTDSIDYPITPGAYDTTPNNTLSVVFVSILDPTLPTAQQLTYSTYIGGTNADEAGAVAMDITGRVIVAGRAESINFPTTTGALQTTHGSPIQADNFIAILDPTQTGTQQLAYSTFFGGNADDWPAAMACDPFGATVTICGTTGSDNLMVSANAYQSASPGPAQSYFSTFVARFDLTATGSQQLVYCSYLAGSIYEFPMDMAVDATGAITVTGGTQSPDYPTTGGAYNGTFTGMFYMGFVSRLDPYLPPAQQLLYSTLFGDDSQPEALTIDASGFQATVVGRAGTNHPTTAGAFSTPPGVNAAFLSRFDMRPTGVTAYGTASPGCAGDPAISTLSWPQVGNSSFALYCTGAGAGSLGVAILNLPALTSPLPILGIDLWVAPVGSILAVVVADPVGRVGLPFPMPANPLLAGFQLHTQFAFYVPGPSPCPAQGWSASDALSITLQP